VVIRVEELQCVVEVCSTAATELEFTIAIKIIERRRMLKLSRLLLRRDANCKRYPPPVFSITGWNIDVPY